jgi:phosphatidylglycerophosphatase A
MVKCLQVKDHEILVAMSFWAMGYPMTLIMGFFLSGLAATGHDQNISSAATTMVHGLSYGPANLLMLGVTTVLNSAGYAYYRYAIRLQKKEVPWTFTILLYGAYLGMVMLVVSPHVKVHISHYQYGLQFIGYFIWFSFSIAWMAYFSHMMKSTGGRAIFLLALTFAGVLFLVSIILTIISDEQKGSPMEWSGAGILIGCHMMVVFMCERDKVMKLNSSGFSAQVTSTPQEYEQL